MYWFLFSSLQTDLSKRVAVSWHNADEEVKLFCAEVSEMLMHEYKKAQHQQRQYGISSAANEDSSTQSRVTKTRNVKKKASRSRSNTLMPPSHVVSSRTTKDIVTDQIISSTTQSMNHTAAYTQPVMRGVLSGPSAGQLSLPLSVYHLNYASSQVDIDDDDIMAMWNVFD